MKLPLVAKSGWWVPWRQVGCAVVLSHSFCHDLGEGGWALLRRALTPGLDVQGLREKKHG